METQAELLYGSKTALIIKLAMDINKKLIGGHLNTKDFRFKNAEGVEYKVLFRKPNRKYYGDDCDGVCSKDSILINPNRTDQTILNTSIHEFAHAFFWDKREYEVAKFANACSRFLYNHCKWRREKE